MFLSTTSIPPQWGSTFQRFRSRARLRRRKWQDDDDVDDDDDDADHDDDEKIEGGDEDDGATRPGQRT